MKLHLRATLICMLIVVPIAVLAQAGAASQRGIAETGAAAASNSPTTARPAHVTVQLLEPSPPAKSFVELYAPYVAALLGLLGIIGTALYTLYRGKMDARYSYASQMMKFRLRQIQEFYAPALVLIEQSRVVYGKLRWTLRQNRKDISLSGFRLLDHICELDKDRQVKPLIDRILAIGNKLTELISTKSGLLEGGITPTFIEYQGHFEILSAAREQEPSEEEKEGWQERGYYPRLLNREIAEGYKVAFKHLEDSARAGDRILYKLLKQPAGQSGTYRRQLIENLYFYEHHAQEYAAKFDSFELSEIRQRFLKELERTHALRRRSVTGGAPEVLDAGCGTGRDAYEFIRKGYVVTGIDASPAMLRIYRAKLLEVAGKSDDQMISKTAQASLERLGEMTFDELRYRDQFDGVWAAASLLHLPTLQLKDVVQKLFDALKLNGILFMSFKYGRGEREYGGRYFTYCSKKQIRTLLNRTHGAEAINIWLSDAKGKILPPAQQTWSGVLEIFKSYDRSLWLNVLAKRNFS